MLVYACLPYYNLFSLIYSVPQSPHLALFDSINCNLDMLVDHSIPTIIPLGRILICIVQTHIQTAEKIGKTEV